MLTECYAPMESSHYLATEFRDRLGPYWASGVKHTENEYADITIPYPDFVREEVWKEDKITLAGWSGNSTRIYVKCPESIRDQKRPTRDRTSF
ncbi:hypothetical protein OUZ56_014784 [Daphnia magna]|uniref:Uncharacterized protein n=1 Tax=Daphnia magna TaxID=35525 RepID=A0ABR0AKY0_9CRUS|nr:hypothetical protein OUZ56_014784 [Daphnia magna]